MALFLRRLQLLLRFFVLFYRVESIGDVHSSATLVQKLAVAEEKIVETLRNFIAREEIENDVIKRYIAGWPGPEQAHTTNPVSSFHLLKRLVVDYAQVMDSLGLESQALRENLTQLKESNAVPGPEDLNGAALALVRLQSVYDLPLDELVEGAVLDAPQADPLSVDDCLLLGQQSFANLEFDLSQMWIEKGLQLLSKEGEQEGVESKIKRITTMMEKQKKVRNLVERLAMDTPEAVLDRFSGLGIPTSFQKTMYSTREGSDQIGHLADFYQKLCRGEPLHDEHMLSSFSCGYVYNKGIYGRLMPFKAELVFHDPLLVVYHDVISDAEIQKLKELSEHRLQTTEVHSFITHKKMKSLARIGKTAWISRGDSPATDGILNRIEDMTGLSTASAEPFHVLNYGVGGHYDAHVDFFDLANKTTNGRVEFGDRMATVLFYLNDVQAGGSTVFPSIGASVPARKGSALFWLNLKRNGHGDYRTLHASCPVLLGEKWIANLWLREEGQEFRWPCSLEEDE